MRTSATSSSERKHTCFASVCCAEVLSKRTDLSATRRSLLQVSVLTDPTRWSGTTIKMQRFDDTEFRPNESHARMIVYQLFIIMHCVRLFVLLYFLFFFFFATLQPTAPRCYRLEKLQFINLFLTARSSARACSRLQPSLQFDFGRLSTNLSRVYPREPSLRYFTFLANCLFFREIVPPPVIKGFLFGRLVYVFTAARVRVLSV